jgi:hypothetical protein
VKHHRRMAPAILADISGSKPPRHVEIKLQSAALPLPADRVAQVEFELRPVERTLAGIVGMSPLPGPHRFSLKISVRISKRTGPTEKRLSGADEKTQTRRFLLWERPSGLLDA